jgi:ABC-2 type transport system ATP-binding protein
VDNIITIKNFYKSFGSKKVIEDLTFEVNRGEIFAFLGANGSGKTTTIRSLLQIYKADKGELLINNKIYSPEMSSMLGYLPEERGLYLSSSVIDALIYFAQLKGVEKKEAKKRSLKFLEEVGLSDKANSKISKLSSGQQQKIQLGITIINNPELLILDEPTKGLDPLNREIFLKLFLDLNKNGSTIIFSTHQMEETEKIADRLIMIKDGKKALYGDVDKIKKQFGENIIHINYKGKLPENEKLYSFKKERNFAEIIPKENIDPTEILSFLIKKGVQLSKFELSSPSLNEIFIEVSNRIENL